MKSVWMCLFGIACAAEKEEKELVSYINGEIIPDNPSISTSGQVTVYKAFAFDNQGTFLAYLSSNPEAHCLDVAEYLSDSGNDSAYDPVQVLSPGKCNITIKLDDWTGSFSAVDDRVLAAASSIECAMGDGTFEYRKLDNQDRADYYWTGENAKWWQGNFRGFSWDISGDKGDGYTLDIQNYEYNGAFIHEPIEQGGVNGYDAFGNVQGVIEAYTCSELASTGFFTG